ncbi:amino acid adenylation domain-containing protein [Clostridium sporogenes]|uniref:Amino acid adenylation domain-containing protein n=1 Tax=Clostridium botulinum TaxID=1491 RepID=A0A6M0SW70_CLOBO|nr:non-ribosomal peptide synthetase [Clostridium sporogenes]NFA58890.1 amino acid adenylation domain-containing protein [Clostridium botulinum]NFI73473.1 amino acid adenylation domain-containing protein [Clostridium sporogenes]NFL71525.1 amino acid adenylation domain-containing protein [Clostridium sporogenes]NFM23332.1 amino acid adenylation domain-containing protein [Clostridium sporogenes]NFP61279.1 amino acid adenylation domain-containing protein [Clostridium sporogenes]
MDIIGIIEECVKRGIQLWTENGRLHFKSPAGALDKDLKENLKRLKPELIIYLEEQKKNKIQSMEDGKYENFPITDIQGAYLVGRNKAYLYGGIGCKIYAEFMTKFTDYDRFLKAVDQLIQRHEMLRVKVSKEGKQVYLEELAENPVCVYDLSHKSQEEKDNVTKEIREKLQFKQYDPEKDALFDIGLCILNESEGILYLSLDMLLGDFVSIDIVVKDLEKLYEEEKLEPLVITFRDFIMYKNREKETMQFCSSYENDKNYWMNRIDTLPAEPELPKEEQFDIIQTGRFYHKEYLVSNEYWKIVEQLSRRYSVTPTSVILAVYSLVLGRWSKNKDFLINITTLNRPAAHNQIDKIIGDFTTTTLFEVKNSKDLLFVDNVRAVQEQLFEDLEHNLFNGVGVLRELNRKNKRSFAPYVFTSTIGVDSENTALSKIKLLYKISQTPQVLIDCQISRQSEGVMINWDIREGVFLNEMIDDMFEVFKNTLTDFIKDDTNWEKKINLSLPSKTELIRKKVNGTKKDYPKENLVSGIYNSFRTYPDKTAVIFNDYSYSYKELGSYVAFVQEQLEKNKIQTGDRVGILLEKGIWQVASVIAVVSMGGIYVPIDIGQPWSRQETIIEQAAIKINIVQEKINGNNAKNIFISKEETISSVKKVKYNEVDPEKSAYTIFTSGSTGTPKGVEMSHVAAMNTITDMYQKFNITHKDKVLGLSNLYFDLSVFDVFGTLSIGGTLVVPLESRKREVSHWASLCHKYNVTILDMVPAQMEMYMAYVEADEKSQDNALRLVLMSGDWIPINLTKKIQSRFSNIDCIGLGGATEAGIWSIYYPTEKLEDTDKNVPYGTPLSNQRFYIIDENDNPCPDYVIGEICIAGDSLAVGYLNDEEMTKVKFGFSKQLGERIYRTGDLGSYRADGVIEFIGRKDTQVKINGYRVELGEVENALKRHMEIENAIVLKESDTSLAAYVKVGESINVENKLEERTFDEDKQLDISFEQDDLRQWVDQADNTALSYILKTLLEADIFKAIRKKYSLEEIGAALNIKPKYVQLLHRWLNALVKSEFIKQDRDLYYTEKSYSEDVAKNAEEKWRAIDAKVNYSDIMMNYMHDSAILLKEILRGEVHPHNLLFPQGKLDIEYALYKDNVVSRNINKVVQNEILNNISEKSNNKIRILEVGAGIGSLDLIKSLGGYDVEFYFTDISNFFFNEAKRNLKDYPWVVYKLYDINKANWEQGFENEKFDFIICGNVLHNAYDLGKALKNLKDMLSEDGEILITEEVKERYALLTSVEFEFAEAIQTYEDGRDSSRTIFMSYEDWKEKVNKLNGNIVLTYPRENDKLYAFGQELMIVKFNKQYSLQEESIKEYLNSQVPEYMVPGKIIFLNELPMTNNGKIDRKLLKNTLAKYENKFKENEIEEELDDLEFQIKNIWCEVIGCKNIRKNDDFYSVGGDSLLVAQVTSRMLQELEEAEGWEWDRLMVELMKNATISKIASRLRESTDKKPTHSKKKTNVSPLVEFKEADGKAVTIRVLFHAGTGTLSSYKELLPYLAEQCDDNEALLGFNFGNAEDYLGRSVDTFIIDSAKAYADILMEQETEKFEVIGYCVGGWIALETAKVLVEKGIEVSNVKIISSSLCGHNFDNDLLLERAFGISIGADVESAGYLGSNELIQEALSEVKAGQEDRGITTEELCQLSGKYKEIGLNFEKLSKMEQGDRLKCIYESLPKSEGAEDNVQMFELLYQLFSHSFRGIMRYTPSRYVGDVHALFVEDDTKHFFPVKNISNDELWDNIVLGDLKIDYIPGEHGNCLKEPNVKTVAGLIK